MRKRGLSLLIHGPFAGNAYNEIFRALNKCRTVNMEEIIIVCYKKDITMTKEICLNWKQFSDKLRFVEIRDLINPGFFNINRQIRTVSAGLKEVSDGAFVIKLRNDQWVDFRKLLLILERLQYLTEGNQQIFTTNCFTRKDRKYHPSDMFLCGWKEELEKYYNCPMQIETQLDAELKLMKKMKHPNKHLEDYLECPESILFRNYLKRSNWEVKETMEDSYNAIRTFCYVVNSWNIGLRWKKKRNPGLPAGSIILPYYFTLAPFQGVPEEKARCYLESDFTGKLKNIQDIWFILISRLLYKFCFQTNAKVKSSLFWMVKYLESRTLIRSMLRRLPGFFWVQGKLYRYIGY